MGCASAKERGLFITGSSSLNIIYFKRDILPKTNAQNDAYRLLDREAADVSPRKSFPFVDHSSQTRVMEENIWRKKVAYFRYCQSDGRRRVLKGTLHVAS